MVEPKITEGNIDRVRRVPRPDTTKRVQKLTGQMLQRKLQGSENVTVSGRLI